ncbi:hypothetical protein [Haladaptatus halobius]|nr:hypothetical protein [Haladaptatus halobius]
MNSSRYLSVVVRGYEFVFASIVTSPAGFPSAHTTRPETDTVVEARTDL